MSDSRAPTPADADTTGHEWDGIRELDTPLPRWWLWTFYATVVWAAVYVVLYPAWPLVSSATRGVLGYSTRGELAKAMDAARAPQSESLELLATLPLEAIAADPNLRRFAEAGGRSAFLVNCVQCHGSGAAGSTGYPNLNDDDWLWGGTLGEIEATIRHGVRFDADPQSHFSQMPSFAGTLSAAEIRTVADYVLSLSGAGNGGTAAAEGAQTYIDNCAACHGESGGGEVALGAPALNDAIWLYGDSREAIAAQIARPRHGVMPAWAYRLDTATIKQLALFVHALGGGRAPETSD